MESRRMNLSRRLRRATVFALGLALGLSTLWMVSAPAQAQSPAKSERFIVMASTTSTEQSGLFAHLLPAFKAATGIDVRVVAVGTGQALDIGRRGDADVLFVHDTAAEEKFLAEGWGLRRDDVMFNDFVLIGPATDPVNVRGKDIVVALRKLSTSAASFISRGDNSGTNAAELRYWKLAGIAAPAKMLVGYKECGCGMGPALNIAAATDAYLISDRGTWLNFKNRARLAVLVEGDKRLFNQYGVIVVNPAKHPKTKTALAQAFADWVLSAPGQASISAYKIGGESVFFPNAR